METRGLVIHLCVEVDVGGRDVSGSRELGVDKRRTIVAVLKERKTGKVHSVYGEGKHTDVQQQEHALLIACL